MIIARFAEERRLELRKRMNELADHLAGGAASSYEDYKSLCGEIRGLAIAESALLTAAERIEKEALDD